MKTLVEASTTQWVLLTVCSDFLQVVITDVNDNAPQMVGGGHFSVQKQNLTSLELRFSLSDVDDWGEGNGPPFSASLKPGDKNSKLFKLIFEGGEV